jgi:hypothetical protein
VAIIGKPIRTASVFDTGIALEFSLFCIARNCLYF